MVSATGGSDLRRENKGHGSLTFVLTGGLGNQLFQIAMAEMVRVRGRPVNIDQRFVRSPFRGLSIPDLSTTPSTVSPELHNCSFDAALVRPAGIPFLSELQHLVSDRSLCCVRGYFQYVELLEAQEVRHRLGNLIGELLAVTGVKVQPEEHNAMHIRLGDYTRSSVAAEYGCLGPQYYSIALERLSARPVRVVTDDRRALRKLLPEVSTFDPRVSVGRLAEAQALGVLVRAQSIAIGNSTFSLWAAWFRSAGRRRVANVYFPSPWFRNGREFELGRLGWTPLESDFLDPSMLNLPMRRLRTSRLRALFW